MLIQTIKINDNIIKNTDNICSANLKIKKVCYVGISIMPMW